MWNRLAVALAAVVLLGACTSEDVPDEGSRPTCSTSKGTLVVGVVAPLGDVQGKGVANSVQLAVDQANKDCAVDGYKLVVQPEDDAGNPDLGAQAATKLAVDAKVVGVVSTISDAVSAAVQPVFESASVLQVSPGNTGDRLSRGDGKRPFRTYFRTCTVDSVQGRAAADYLVKAKKRNIAVVTDGQAYGEALGLGFSERAGASVATWQRVDGGVRDFAGVIAAVTPFKPDAVFFGGGYAQGAVLSKQLAAAGLNVPMMGGNALISDAYLTTGGRDGDLATSVGASVDEAFGSAYEAAGYAEPAGPYGAYAYDAANVIIGALGETVGGEKWSISMRKDLLARAGEYEGDGATGKIAFDEFGDVADRVVAVHRVAGGKWEVVRG